MYEDIIGAQRQAYAQMGQDVPGSMVQHQGYSPEAGPLAYVEGDALINRPVQQAPMYLQERHGLRFQRQWYGFPRTWICPGETVRIVGQAQVRMKIIRIFIDDSVGSSLLVSSFVTGKNDAINGDAISAVVYSPSCVDAYPQTESETIQPGCTASITLENIGDVKLLVVVSARVAIAW